MKKLGLILALVASLIAPAAASASAFTPQQIEGMKALCRIYPNSLPPGADISLSQWQSACVYFLHLP